MQHDFILFYSDKVSFNFQRFFFIDVLHLFKTLQNSWQLSGVKKDIPSTSSSISPSNLFIFPYTNVSVLLNVKFAGAISTNKKIC